MNLYNREPADNVDEWVDSQIRIMWSMQDSAHREGLEEFRGRGVIEGWHGDGNFARTIIMYCLWKTQGITLTPWNETLVYGAENDQGLIKLTISSEQEWRGIIHFDTPRHKTIFHLPMDYPRINQFPEWFTIDENKKYRITRLDKKESAEYSGAQLSEGLQIEVRRGGKIQLEIEGK